LLLLAGAARRNSRLPDKTARDAVDDLMVLGILKSKTELADSWEESLRDVGKLFRTPPLQKCATVSGFLEGWFSLSTALRVFSASLRNAGTKASSNSGFKDDEH
jgi:hypothetical protein